MKREYKVKKAMIMAAGVGSRLEPLTLHVPKPLIPVFNVPIMDILLNNLKNAGIEMVVSNLHYLSEEIENYYKYNKILPIEFVFENELSGTAGGVNKCKYFFDENEDFLVVSADGLCDIDFNNLIKHHKKSNAICTIAVKEIEKEKISHYGVIVTDKDGYVKDFQEKPKIEDALSNIVNTGIYIFNYRIFNYIKENGFCDFAKNVFPDLLSNCEKIATYKFSDYWNDIGTIQEYINSNCDILNGKVKSYNNFSKKINKSKNSDFANMVKSNGYCVVGKNCKFGQNVHLDNVIIWDNVEIKDNVLLKNVIVGNNVKINKNVENYVIKPYSII